VKPAEGQLRGDRAGQGQKHIPLGVPDIALRAEEGVRVATADQGGPPFDHFIESAEGEADAARQDEQPFAGPQWRFSQQNFTGENGRDKSLREMAKPVIVVA